MFRHCGWGSTNQAIETTQGYRVGPAARPAHVAPPRVRRHRPGHREPQAAHQDRRGQEPDGGPGGAPGVAEGIGRQPGRHGLVGDRPLPGRGVAPPQRGPRPGPPDPPRRPAVGRDDDLPRVRRRPDRRADAPAPRRVVPEAGDRRGPGPSPQADQHPPPPCRALRRTQPSRPLGVARPQPGRTGRAAPAGPDRAPGPTPDEVRALLARGRSATSAGACSCPWPS